MTAARRGDLDGVLARVVARLGGRGEERAGQGAMARAVAEALGGPHHLVVRAGTGIGKSLGYLVPAALSGRKVLVATATRALQDQLVEKDVPLVRAALEHPPTVAVLKGRANYLCRQRLAEAAVAGEQQRLGESPGRSRPALQARAIARWAERTASGDRAELDFEPDERVWSSFSVGADECPGARACPSGATCFAERARAAAAEADVVVVNLHLLGAHLASGAAVLPEFDALVVDEAHELEEVLSRSLGFSVSAGRVRALLASARSALRGDEGEEVLRLLGDSAGALEESLARCGETRLRGGLPDDLASTLALLSERLSRLESACATPEAADQARLRVQLATAHLREQVDSLASVDDERVVWAEAGPRPSVEVAPLDLAPACARLFDEVPVVLTSATVPLGTAERLGAAPARVETLAIESPFDYERHALLYCAAHLPDRRSAAFEAAMVDEVVELVAAAGGRTLALFTSRAVMGRCAEAVAPRVAFPVLVQDRLSRAAALEAFSADPEACLFATMGFWQGIDVPGETLSLVVIDRIPFARPDDPLAAARRERAGPAGFRTVDLPRAQSLLAQGAGRLIRNATDRGVVAVLDPRLASAPYRWELVRALPPMRRTKERAEALAFLAQVRAATTAPPQ